jgi:hypothetical protein
MSTFDLRLMEVERLDFQYGEVSKSHAVGVVVERVAAGVVGDVAAGVDKTDVDGCLAVGTSMLMPGREATTRTSRLVYMLERQMMQSLLECQKRD